MRETAGKSGRPVDFFKTVIKTNRLVRPPDNRSVSAATVTIRRVTFHSVTMFNGRFTRRFIFRIKRSRENALHTTRTHRRHAETPKLYRRLRSSLDIIRFSFCFRLLPVSSRVTFRSVTTIRVTRRNTYIIVRARS